MKEIVLVIDESGAKGNAKTQEQYEKELGVMAGFVYRPDEIKFFDTEIAKIIQPFIKNDKDKFHITDLDVEVQEQIRNDLFNFMKEQHIQWFYHAIFAEGFHQSEFDTNRSPKPNPSLSLHSQLFSCMFTQSLMMVNSIAPDENINLLVITDPIDIGVQKIIKKDVEIYLKVLTRTPIERTIKVGNKKTRSSKQVETVIEIDSADLPRFNYINFSIKCEKSPITILADILANSTHHYLKKYALNGGNILNDIAAIKNHPVADLAYINDANKGIGNMVLDTIYRRE